MKTMNNETVMLSAEQHQKLVDDSTLLNLLRAYGVDNWSGYDDAIREYFKLTDDEEDDE